MKEKTLWEMILEKSKRCCCNKNQEQQDFSAKLQKNNRFATPKEQKKYLTDLCGNSYKISLMDLEKIFSKFDKS